MTRILTTAQDLGFNSDAQKSRYYELYKILVINTT